MLKLARHICSFIPGQLSPTRELRSLRKKSRDYLGETLEERVLLTIQFTFTYEDVIGGGDADGFEDPTEGQARRDALEETGELFGAFFDHDTTITVSVTSSDDSESSTLASAGSGIVSPFTNGFDNMGVAQRKILTGVDRNGSGADANVDVNWGKAWDIDDDIQAGFFDFKGVMMHELAHALGWSSYINQDGTTIFGDALGDPAKFSPYDQFLSDKDGNAIIDQDTFELSNDWTTLSVEGNSASDLGLYFNGTSAMAANGGRPVGLYTPTTWNGGSSVSHIDTSNPEYSGLMLLHAVTTGPAARTMSAIERGVFRDLGYKVIQSEPSDKQHILGRSLSSGSWWLAGSDGTSFTSTHMATWTTAADWRDIMTGDFNGDGLSDIAGRMDGNWWVGISNGTQFTSTVWNAWSDSGQWKDVMSLDVNGDGMDDIAGRSNGNWWVAVSNGTSFTTSKFTRWTDTGQWVDVMVADVNGDSRDDIIGRANGNWWAAISNETSFSNSLFGTWSNSATWVDVGIGDFDGDGNMDVTGRTNGNWWVSLSNGTSFSTQFWKKWTTNNTWSEVIFGDFSGDGKTDIAGRYADGRWYVNVSNGTSFDMTIWGSWSTSATWQDVQLIDVNNDGWDDIVGRAVSGSSSWWVAISDGASFSTSLFGSWSNPANGWGNVTATNPLG